MPNEIPNRSPYDPQALILEGNEYAALGFLQGAVLHTLTDGGLGTFDIARYKAAVILQTAEREVMGEAIQKRSLSLIGLSLSDATA